MLKREVGLHKQQHNPIAGEGAHDAIDAAGRTKSAVALSITSIHATKDCDAVASSHSQSRPRTRNLVSAAVALRKAFEVRWIREGAGFVPLQLGSFQPEKGFR